jgi:hypothetical protein
MGAGVLRPLRSVVSLALLVGTLLIPSGRMTAVQGTTAPAVESVTGAGWVDRAMCLGCVVGLFGAGGATLGGVLVEAMLYPEAFAACGIICVRAL